LTLRNVGLAPDSEDQRAVLIVSEGPTAMSGTGVNSFLAVIQNRIDEIADQAGIVGQSRLGIDETLAALPRRYRRRVSMYLESLRAFSPDPGQRAAAETLQRRAAAAWDENPPSAFDGRTPGDRS
jgi:hypothetical protein